MQEDWNTFGKEKFEFICIESGSEWVDDEKRLLRESQLVNEHMNSGGIVYNIFFEQNRKRYPSCPLKARETILNNQTPEYREYISNLNKGREHSGRKGVASGDNIFLSVTEAADALTGGNRLQLRRLLKNNSVRLATPEEITKEKNLRNSPNYKPPDIIPIKRLRGGQPRPCLVNWEYFESLEKAAEKNNLTTPTIIGRLNKALEGRSSCA